jgi:arabinoxylan arabinofuranohydrolase
MNKIASLMLIACSILLSAQVSDIKTVPGSKFVRDRNVITSDPLTYISKQNPVFPSKSQLFIADPEPKVFDGKLYVYGSLDEKKASVWCSKRYHVVYTEDLIHWTDAGVSFHIDSIPEKYRNASQTTLWAPDLIRNPRDGKYYLFLCTDGIKGTENRIFVAVSDKPEGPFKNAVPLLIDGKIPIGNSADPGVMIDDDGKAYVTWPFKIAQLDPQDYSKVIGHTIVDVKQWMPSDYRPFEGPSLRKMGNMYYYIYIQNNNSKTSMRKAGMDQPSRMAYMTSKNPLGPYAYRGLIVNTTNYPNSINVHGSFVNFKNKWYLFYHLPIIDKRITRTMCIDELKFNADGSINCVNITSSGAKGPFLSGDIILAGSAVIWPDKEKRPEFKSRENEEPVIIFNAINEWVGYRHLKLKNTKNIEIQGSFQTKGNKGTIEIRLNSPDGPKLASFNVPDTGGQWQTITTNILGKHNGIYTFYVMMVNNEKGGHIEFEWIQN